MTIKKKAATSKPATKKAAPKKTATKGPTSAPRGRPKKANADEVAAAVTRYRKKYESKPLQDEIPPAAETAAPVIEPGILSADAQAHLQGLAVEAAGDAGPVQGQGDDNAPQGEQQGADEVQQQEAARMGAVMTAHMAVGLGEKVLTHYHPYVVLEQEQRQGLAAALADVLAKYAGAGTLPPWVVQYVLPFIEELKLLAKVGTIGYAVYAQVQQEKARIAAEVEKKRQQQEQQQRGGGVDLSREGAPA